MVLSQKVVGRARGGRAKSPVCAWPRAGLATGRVAPLMVLGIFICLVSSVSQGPFVFANIPVDGRKCVNKSLLNECGGWGMALG